MTKPKTKTAAALEDVLSNYDRIEREVFNTVFNDYYADVLSACLAKARDQVTAKGLNPAIVPTNIEHFVPVCFWVLIPGISPYMDLSDEPTITRLCAWVDMPCPYFDQDSALSSMIRRGHDQLRDAFLIKNIDNPTTTPTYSMIRSYVERAPALKLLFPKLTFLPRRATPTLIPMPDLTDAISILTMYQTMTKENQ